MDAISIRCKSCKHPMKFSADKAGKKAKCPKCGTLVLIQMEAPPPPAPEPSPAAADPDVVGLAPLPEAAPPPAGEETKPVIDEFDESGPMTYEARIDPELEKLQQERALAAETKVKEKKVKKRLPGVGRKVKALPDAESWLRVRIGLFCVSIGCWIWLASHLLQGIYVLAGSTDFSEYATLIARNVAAREGAEDFPPPGKPWDMDYLDIYLQMIAGRDQLPLARFCITVATVIYFLQVVLWAVGYGFCLPVPRRYGMFGQVLAMLGLAIFNIFFIIGFKLLPVLGVHSYILIPYVVPEIAMTEYNIDRAVPIHVLFSAQPFWENLLTLVLRFTQYIEPTFGCILMWSIGVAIKSPDVEKLGRGLTKMSLGTLFTLLCFHLMSLCGCSGVLVNVVRVIYACWFFFMILFILRYAMALLKTRLVLYEKINPKFELQE